jgi:hypothetical protein
MEKKGKYIQLYMFEAPENQEMEEDWNENYNMEHIPLVLKFRSGVIRAYRYAAIEREGEAPKYMTLYEMEIPDAMSREKRPKELEKALNKDWYRKVQQHYRGTGRGSYKQIYPEE